MAKKITATSTTAARRRSHARAAVGPPSPARRGTSWSSSSSSTPSPSGRGEGHTLPVVINGLRGRSFKLHLRLPPRPFSSRRSSASKRAAPPPTSRRSARSPAPDRRDRKSRCPTHAAAWMRPSAPRGLRALHGRGGRRLIPGGGWRPSPDTPSGDRQRADPGTATSREDQRLGAIHGNNRKEVRAAAAKIEDRPTS